VSIGETLASARERAGLSVDQVSEATRIRQTIISAIEHDDFRLCGGDFYARGHVRSIAQVVGADPAPLIAEFDASHDDAGQRSIEALQSETYAVKRHRGPNWTAAMAAVLVLVLGYGVFQLATRGGDGGGTTPPQSQPQSTVTASHSPRPTATPSSTPTGDGPVAVAPKKGVAVKVALVSGRSWISVRDKSGAQLYQGVLEQGTRKTFSDKKLVRLVLGNAGAVQLTVNGQDLGTPGGSGQVVHLEFGPGDPQAG